MNVNAIRMDEEDKITESHILGITSQTGTIATDQAMTVTTIIMVDRVIIIIVMVDKLTTTTTVNNDPTPALDPLPTTTTITVKIIVQTIIG